jgi:hypothetical protein
MSKAEMSQEQRKPPRGGRLLALADAQNAAAWMDGSTLVPRTGIAAISTR